MIDVYLIGCTKLKQKKRCIAEKMYSASPLYKAAYNYAISKVENKDTQIFILSAKYGLLPLNQKIEPYYETLKDMKKDEIDIWKNSVYKTMKEKFDLENTHFIFLAGQAYIEPLLPFLDDKNWTNPVPKDCRTIGKRIEWLKNNTTFCGKIVEAKKLRNVDFLNTISKNMPGWYKWWAPKDALEKLLNSPYIKDKYFDELVPYLTKKKINNKDYYYIYVGIAVKESINKRLNWHVNQHHTDSAIKSGMLSTLRKTISSLVAANQYNEKLTNELIDMLVIEYYPVNFPIKSKKAKKIIEDIEIEQIQNNVLPLNIMCNKNKIVKKFLKELTSIRKESLMLKESVEIKKLKEFLVEAKKQTYANENIEKINSSRLNSKDYEYKKEGMIYHDTYFGGTNFIGEEIVYFENKVYWGMNYHGVTFDGALTEEVMDKVLRVALMMVGKDDIIPLRGPKEFINGEYRYTFSVKGNLECFSGKETIYKNNKKIYELKCNGGLIK